MVNKSKINTEVEFIEKHSRIRQILSLGTIQIELTKEDEDFVGSIYQLYLFNFYEKWEDVCVKNMFFNTNILNKDFSDFNKNEYNVKIKDTSGLWVGTMCDNDYVFLYEINSQNRNQFTFFAVFKKGILLSVFNGENYDFWMSKSSYFENQNISSKVIFNKIKTIMDFERWKDCYPNKLLNYGNSISCYLNTLVI